MIGILKEYASQYMYIVAIGTLLLFGLPLTFWPLRWAKILKWTIPEQTHLAIYFGRCLGGVISAMALFAVVSVGAAATLKFFYQLILLLFIIMIVVHVYGALKRIQPISETIEIAYWIVLVFLTLLFYPHEKIIIEI